MRSIFQRKKMRSTLSEVLWIQWCVWDLSLFLPCKRTAKKARQLPKPGIHRKATVRRQDSPMKANQLFTPRAPVHSPARRIGLRTRKRPASFGRTSRICAKRLKRESRQVHWAAHARSAPPTVPVFPLLIDTILKTQASHCACGKGVGGRSAAVGGAGGPDPAARAQ